MCLPFRLKIPGRSRFTVKHQGPDPAGLVRRGSRDQTRLEIVLPFDPLRSLIDFNVREYIGYILVIFVVVLIFGKFNRFPFVYGCT